MGATKSQCNIQVCVLTRDYTVHEHLYKAPLPQGLRPRHDLAAAKKIDNHREVAQVVARFYKGGSKVSDLSPYKTSCGQSFEHEQKTSRD